MSNNRLYLVYRPTGRCVLLGKRMARGWGARTGLSEKVSDLFEHVESTGGYADDKYSQDDFALCLESGAHQPHCLTNPTDWAYSEINGQLDLRSDLPYGTGEGI